MSATGEAISSRISASTAARSSPTRAVTRSLRTCSRVGVDTTPLLWDDAVAHLHLGAGGDALHLRHREPVADLRHARGGDLFVELAQQLTGDGMHDRDPVAAQAQHAAGPEAVEVGEVDHDANAVHVHDVA